MIRQILTQCEAGTRAHISANAANRLAAWRNHPSDHDIVAFIQRLIRVRDNQANGVIIDRSGGIALEAIVLEHCPDHFSDEDREIATNRLGR